MLLDKEKLMASVEVGGVLCIYCSFLSRSCRFEPSRPYPGFDYRTESEFYFDSRTYFLFLVRGLVSYQDEGKCQDGGSTVRRRNSGLPDTQITRKLLCNRFSCLKSKMRIKPGNRVALKICPGNNTLFYLFLQIDLFY